MSVYDTIAQFAREKALTDYQIATREYEAAVNEGDVVRAAEMQRHLRYHAKEIDELAPKLQVNQAELSWIQHRPAILNNPKKLQEVSDAYYKCRNAGMNERQALDLMSHRFDSRPGKAEVPTPDDVVDIVSRSKYFNGDKDDARQALSRSWHDVQRELANRGGKWEQS